MTPSDFPFRARLRTRYSEIDAQAIVYNAHYLTYFDIGITEYFRHIGCDLVGYAASTGHDFHVVRAVVEYAKPIRLDREIDVAVRVARLGSSSLAFAIAIFAADGGVVHATGEIVCVHADQATHRSVPVPDDLRLRLAPLPA